MSRKPKFLRVLRKGAVLEETLPEILQKKGPKWLKAWPKVRLIRKRKPPPGGGL